MTVDVVMYDEPKMPTAVNSNSHGANISPLCQAGNVMLGYGRAMNIEVVYNQALKKALRASTDQPLTHMLCDCQGFNRALGKTREVTQGGCKAAPANGSST